MATIKSISKQLSKIQRDLKKLDTSTEKTIHIDHCNNKDDLKKFKVSELKDWLYDNGVEPKKIKTKIKDELISMVLKTIEQNESSSDSESEEDSESDFSSNFDSDSDSDSESEF